MTFANSSDPDQAWQNVRPDLDPYCLTLIDSWRTFLKKVDFENIEQTTKNMQFDLILYVPSTIFQLCMDVSSWIEPELS